MKKQTTIILAIALALGVTASALAAQQHTGNYNTVATVDSKGNSTYLHPSAKWDGAYFPKMVTLHSMVKQ